MPCDAPKLCKQISLGLAFFMSKLLVDLLYMRESSCWHLQCPYKRKSPSAFVDTLNLFSCISTVNNPDGLLLMHLIRDKVLGLVASKMDVTLDCKRNLEVFSLVHWSTRKREVERAQGRPRWWATLTRLEFIGLRDVLWQQKMSRHKEGHGRGEVKRRMAFNWKTFMQETKKVRQKEWKWA